MCTQLHQPGTRDRDRDRDRDRPGSTEGRGQQVWRAVKSKARGQCKLKDVGRPIHVLVD